jgi:hypothetical protein
VKRVELRWTVRLDGLVVGRSDCRSKWFPVFTISYYNLPSRHEFLIDGHRFGWDRPDCHTPLSLVAKQELTSELKQNKAVVNIHGVGSCNDYGAGRLAIQWHRPSSS